MPYSVTFTITNRPVEKKDIAFSVKQGDGVLGSLHISQGTVDWRPRGKHSPKYKLTWEEFAEAMQEYVERH